MNTAASNSKIDPHAIVDVVNDLAAFDTPEWTETLLTMGPEYQVDIQKAFPSARKRLNWPAGDAPGAPGLAQKLKSDFQDKDEIIDLMFISAIAQEPMLIFGLPGTAKSDLVARFAEGLGARRFDVPNHVSPASQAAGQALSHPPRLYFEYLLNQFTEPDELFGPVEVAALTKNPPQFKRFRDGMLSNAAIVFLDEIFRANSAILNALLSLINERRTYEAGTAVKADLLVLFGAANNPPASEDLQAFYERFPLRVISSPVDFTPEKRLGLLEKGWRIEANRLAAGYDPALFKISQHACLNDLLLCSRAAVFLWAPADVKKDAFIRVYEDLVASLHKDSRDLCRIDDRKFIRLYKLMRARSLYYRAGPPDIEDLALLKYTWHDFVSVDPLANLVDASLKNLLAPKKP